VALLQQSLAQGLAARGAIARAFAEAQGGDPAVYEAYLTRNIRYTLGAEELSGLSALFDRARAAGLITRAVRPRLYESPKPAAPARSTAPRSVDALLADAAGGGRLAPDDALRLYADAPTLELGAAADQRRRASTPTTSSPTSSTATSTTPTSASPAASSATSTARPPTRPTATC